MYRFTVTYLYEGNQDLLKCYFRLHARVGCGRATPAGHDAGEYLSGNQPGRTWTQVQGSHRASETSVHTANSNLGIVEVTCQYKVLVITKYFLILSTL